MNTHYRTSNTVADFDDATRRYFAGKTVAVTGGDGFIGSHVTEQLSLLGANTIVLSRRGPAAKRWEIPERVQWRECDLTDLNSARRGLQDAQIVLNVAATVAGIEYNNRHPASIFHANMQSFLNAIKAATEKRVERFLVVSSACVYPRECSIPTPEAEGFLREPEPTNSGYGWAKRMEEFLGAKYAVEYGLEVAIARPYNAYGPRDNFSPDSSHVIPALIRKAFLSSDGTLPVWGDGSHSRSFLYVDDFARGLLEIAARYPAADAVNLGADEETTIAALAAVIAELVGALRGREITPQFQPAGLTGQPRRRCDLTHARSRLGFETQVPLKEGLRRTVEWYAAHQD